MKLDVYFDILASRQKNTRVTTDFQLAGLEIATLLGDTKHKSLYIKLAKQHGIHAVMSLAKSVAQRHDVKNPGAYFMRLIAEMKKGQ